MTYEWQMTLVLGTAVYIFFTLLKFVVFDTQPVNTSDVGGLIVRIVIFPCILFVVLDLMSYDAACAGLASKCPKAL